MFAIIKRHDFQQWHVTCPLHGHVTPEGKHRRCCKAIGLRAVPDEDELLRKLRFWVLQGRAESQGLVMPNPGCVVNR